MTVKWRKFLTKSEEADLATKMLNGDNDARWQMILNHEPLIIKMAVQTLRQRGLSMKLEDELTNHLLEKAYNVALGFKPDKGRFSSFLYWHLWMAADEFCGEMKFSTVLSSAQLQHLYKVRSAVGDLRHRGELVTVEAVAALTDLPLARVNSLLNNPFGIVVRSLNRQVYQGGEDSEVEFIDLMVDENTPNGEEALLVKSDNQRQRELINQAFGLLTEREQKFIMDRYCSGGEKLLAYKDIGAKYDISIERVRQILEKALGKMREHVKKQGGV